MLKKREKLDALQNLEKRSSVVTTTTTTTTESSTDEPKTHSLDDLVEEQPASEASIRDSVIPLGNDQLESTTARLAREEAEKNKKDDDEEEEHVSTANAVTALLSDPTAVMEMFFDQEGDRPLTREEADEFLGIVRDSVSRSRGDTEERPNGAGAAEETDTAKFVDESARENPSLWPGGPAQYYELARAFLAPLIYVEDGNGIPTQKDLMKIDGMFKENQNISKEDVAKELKISIHDAQKRLTQLQHRELSHHLNVQQHDAEQVQ